MAPDGDDARTVSACAPGPSNQGGSRLLSSLKKYGRVLLSPQDLTVHQEVDGGLVFAGDIGRPRQRCNEMGSVFDRRGHRQLDPIRRSTASRWGGREVLTRGPATRQCRHSNDRTEGEPNGEIGDGRARSPLPLRQDRWPGPCCPSGLYCCASGHDKGRRAERMPRKGDEPPCDAALDYPVASSSESGPASAHRLCVQLNCGMCMR